jgi:hypothetical protein
MKLLSSVFPGIQGECKENDLDQKQIQNEGEIPCFSPDTNLWAQVRHLYFDSNMEVTFDQLARNIKLKIPPLFCCVWAGQSDDKLQKRVDNQFPNKCKG